MEPLPQPKESELQAHVELSQPQEFDPMDPPQESEPQSPVEQPQPQEFDPTDPPQESEPQAAVKLPQEFDPVDPSQESESPRPTLVTVDTAAKLAHKLLEKWCKEAGKHFSDDKETAAEPPREMSKEVGDEGGFVDTSDPFYWVNSSRGVAEFDPSDLSQYARRYVAATRPTEAVTDNNVIVKAYKWDDAEEDKDANDQRD